MINKIKIIIYITYINLNNLSLFLYNLIKNLLNSIIKVERKETDPIIAK